MKRRWRIMALGVALIALAVLVLWPRPTEPSYQGKTLSQWLEWPNVSLFSHMGEEEQITHDSAEAILYMGTNVIPFLLEWIEYEPARWKRKVAENAQKWPDWLADNRIIKSFVVNRSWARAESATMGFYVLGPEAKSAMPKLNELILKDGNGISHDISRRASYSLACIGKDALPYMLDALKRKDPFAPAHVALMARRGVDVTVAVPLMLQILADDTDPGLAREAARWLGQIKLEPTTVVPGLAAAAKKERPNSVRTAAMTAACRFGADADPIIPVLIENLRDPDVYIVERAANSLGKLKLQPKATVPALARSLREQNSAGSRIAVIEALQAFGPDARVALPELKAIVNEQDDSTSDGKPEHRAVLRAIQSIQGRHGQE